jgi:hypothetical protein
LNPFDSVQYIQRGRFNPISQPRRRGERWHLKAQGAVEKLAAEHDMVEALKKIEEPKKCKQHQDPSQQKSVIIMLEQN